MRMPVVAIHTPGQIRTAFDLRLSGSDRKNVFPAPMALARFSPTLELAFMGSRQMLVEPFPRRTNNPDDSQEQKQPGKVTQDV